MVYRRTIAFRHIKRREREPVCFYTEEMFIIYNLYLSNIFISMELVPAEMVWLAMIPVGCVAYGILVNPF
jgi:hypothetical protein